MIVVITSIELKSPFHFFSLSLFALKTTKQLSATHCLAFKKIGFWKKHYTMTLWRNEQDSRSFARSEAHLEAMKSSSKIAKEVRITVLNADTLPSWEIAKSLLKKGKVIHY